MSISAPVVSNAGPLMALAKLNLLHRPAVEGDGRRPGADECAIGLTADGKCDIL